MFEGLVRKASANARANQVLADARNAYQGLVRVRDHLALYQAGTDVEFTAAVDGFFSPEERMELGAIAVKMTALVEDLAANHADFVRG